MKMIRRMMCLLMALSVMASITLTVAAADYTAGTYTELESAFAATNNTSGDTTVNVTVTDNITFNGSLTAMENYTYNIKAGEGSNASLTDASFSGEGNGAGGTVVIDGMDLSGDVGLTATNGVNVTVNGNITGDDYDGVQAENSTVTVVGNITGVDDAVQAVNSTVTVTGDLEGGYGVYAYAGSDVTVTGDISAGFDGILVSDSSVEVTGNITAGGWGVDAENSTVSVEGNITSEYIGVDARNNSDVSVEGNINAGDTGVYADDSNVSVEGNITADEVGVYADYSTVSVEGNITADEVGVDTWQGAVSVTGNVTAGAVGAYVLDSDLSVTGNVTGTEGYGLAIGDFDSTDETMNIFVGGAVSGSNIKDEDWTFTDIYVGKESEEAEANVALTVGSYNSINFYNFTDAQKAAFIANIKVLNQFEDLFWQKVMTQLLAAEEGSTVTIDAAHRTTMPEKVVQIVQERELTLIIQWDGGEDITIDASFDAEPVNGVYKLADL